MAFQYFTEQKIKLIDVENIPPEFKNYYDRLSDLRKKEIMALRPDLIHALFPEVTETNDNDNTETEETTIIDKWESMTSLAWRKDVIDASVLVCKVIPNDLRKCPVHRVPLEKKQLKYRNVNGGIFNISGFFCPECMDFFIETNKIEKIAKNAAERGIPAWIQPCDMTLAEWDTAIIPLDFNDDTPIYHTDTWPNGSNKCPTHPNSILEPERYQRSCNERTIVFNATICRNCNKIIISKADARKLEKNCEKNGIKRINFRPLEKHQNIHGNGKAAIIPDYIIKAGGKKAYQSENASDFEKLTEKSIVIVGYASVCETEGHETYDDYAIIDVQTKTTGIRHCLTLLGYCIHCKKYYLELDNYNRLLEIGRPEVTIIDETKDDETDHTNRSGSAFEQEKNHLRCLENDLTQYVADIKAKPDYIEKYATLSFGYDDGDLKWRKYKSEPYYQEIARVTALRPKPYGYRVDFTSGEETKEYYLGIDDIIIGSENRVISFNNKEGRKLVNYRTTSIEKDGKRWTVKRRREYDIVRENLFGFTEYTAGISSATSNITDPFLIAVLKARRSQHQLVEIISTIQENQDKIVDEPLNKNLIIQGCAGSGKTMVLLHRLSALKYENSNKFDFTKTIILTPSKNFNIHIDGLAESLQIGIITRSSVEEYYNALLNEYSSDLSHGANLVDEQNEDQEYVDYLYSDDFFKLFSSIYEEKIFGVTQLRDEVNTISLQFGRNQIYKAPESVEELISIIDQELTYNRALLRSREIAFENEQKKLKEHQKRYESILQNITVSEERYYTTIIPETLAAAAELSQAIDDTKEKLHETRSVLDKAVAEEEKLEKNADKANTELENTFRLTLEKIDQEINGNTRDAVARLNLIKQELAANTKEKSRLSREKIIAEAQIETTIEAYRVECLDLLKEEETVLKRERTQINQQIADKREEYSNIERRILVTRKTERLRGIQRELGVLEQEKKQINNELDEINQYILYNSIYTGRKDFYTSISQIKSFIPRVDEMESELIQREAEITQLTLSLREAEEKSVQLQQEATTIKKLADELKAKLPDIQLRPNPDTFPEYLKQIQGLLVEPEQYLNEIRTVRQNAKKANEALDECKGILTKAEEECNTLEKKIAAFDTASQNLPDPITKDNWKDYIRIIIPLVPSARKHLTTLEGRLANIDRSKDALIKKQEDIELTKGALEQADNNRFPPELQEKLKALEEEQKKLNPKTIYNEVFSSAIESAGNRLGNWFVEANSRTRGIHRYDLYLRLRFAMKFFGKVVGTEKLICIDEGQDLAANEYALLRDINNGQAVFNIYGDTNQLLKENRGISDWSTIRQLFPSSAQHTLNENYRNTNQITLYCNEAFGMDVKLTGVDGRDVKQIDRIRLEEELSAITPDDRRYAIILPRSVKKETYLQLALLPEYIKDIMGNEIGIGRIAIVYVDEIKGLEFDVVFAVHNGMTKNEKYIAFTRALSELTIVTDNFIPPAGIDSALLEINGAQRNGRTDLTSYDGIIIGKVFKKGQR